MPGRLIVHAIEAADLTQGTGLTPPVAAAVGVVAAAVLDDIGAARRLSASWPRSEPPANDAPRNLRAVEGDRRWSPRGGTPASGRSAPGRLR
jgi:hypothetical protein